MKSNSLFWNTIFIILIAGTLDLTLACIEGYLINNIIPNTILKFIASGILGNDAFLESNETILIGLLIHYLITAIFTFTYIIFVEKYELKNSNIYLTGIIYGSLIWVLMNFIIVPLSNAPTLTWTFVSVCTSIIIQIIGIGIPITFLYKKFRL